MKYIDELKLENKRVLIRADLDVPLKGGEITDDHRLQAGLTTICYALEQNAKVIIMGHMGRPKGQRVDSLSLAPVAKRFTELLSKDVQLAPATVGEEVAGLVEKMNAGDVLVLENTRFNEGEEKNDSELSKQLAALADVYINNAFATTHRKHASTAGVCEFVAEKGAGFTIKDEIAYFEKALSKPERPLIVVFGGAKISTKMKAVKNVAPKADKIIVGGAMANTFFKAMGHEVGKSLYEEEQVALAKECIAEIESSNCSLLLPTDVIVAEEFKGGIPYALVGIDGIPATHMALDIGPESLSTFENEIANAATVVWNGPMGAFEIEEYSSGTYGIVDALVRSTALTVVGGGDTDLALHRRNAMDKMSFVSTGGGAFLTLLEGTPLLAIEALG